jgi:triphosphoribosyl-dephospho-CoA synthetase
MKRYLTDRTIIDPRAWGIGEAILKGVLLEAAASPKPGLVCHGSNGSHIDMNILTFMASSAAIAPAFYLFAQAGLDHKGNISALLHTLRGIGISYEKKLLESTKGVNTQRGLLFSAGVLGGAAGYYAKSHHKTCITAVFDLVRHMARGLVANELKGLSHEKTGLTAGEKLYLRYGVTGIRGEAEAGFPSILYRGLPALKTAFGKEKPLTDSLVHSLISLMAELDDTTILWRAGKEQLVAVQKCALEVLEKGSVFTKKDARLLTGLTKNAS